MSSLNLALVVSLADKASRPLQRLGGNVQALGAQAERVGRRVSGIGATAVPRLTLPIIAFGGFSLRATGQLEQMEVAFESMLGGADRAKTMVKDLTDFAARTPFQLTGIGGATRQLLALKVPQREIIGELSVLGDVAAGAVVPLEDMAQIYAKTMAKGKAQTEELNQLSERGVPILDALVDLAARYGNEISKEDVYKAAERGQISFETLREALGLLTEEGGVFHRQMEKQSQTLFGLFSTLKDNVFNALAELGEKVSVTFSVKSNMQRFIDWVGDATERFKQFADERPGLVRLALNIVGIAATVGPALIALGVAVSVVGIAVSGLGAAIAVLAGPVGLAVAAIAGAAWLLRDRWGDVLEWLQNAWASMLAWFGGPGEDQSIFDWLTAPITGLFEWIPRAWEAAMAWIGANAPGIWAWLSSGTAGVFDWLTDQWDAAMAWIGASAPNIWAWLSAGTAGVFDWLTDQWDGIMARLASSGFDVWALFSFTEDFSAWTFGLVGSMLVALSAAVAAIDWGKVGKLLVVGLAGLGALLNSAVRGLFRALPVILVGAGKLLVAVFKGTLELLVGVVDGILGTDLLGAFERFRAWLANFSLLDVMAGWWSGVAGWFGRKWGEIKVVVQVVGWIAELAAYSLLDVMAGWWSGVAGWFGRKWGEIKVVVQVVGWIAELAAYSLLDAMAGWWSGTVAWFGRKWAAVKAVVQVVGWIAELAAFSLLDAMAGWWSGVASWFADKWAAVKAAVPVGEWLDALRGFSLWAVLTGWWDGVENMFREKWADILSVFPEFLQTRLGFDVDVPDIAVPDGVLALGDNAAQAAPAAAEALGVVRSDGSIHATSLGPEPRRSLFGRDAPGTAPATGPGGPVEARVGGEIRLAIDDERIRVKRLRSDNPDFDLSVEHGRSMAY